jgi:hypothetical protein
MSTWSVRFFAPKDAADLDCGDIQFVIYRIDAANTVWVMGDTPDGPRQRVWVAGQKAPIHSIRALGRFTMAVPRAQLDFDPAVES